MDWRQLIAAIVGTIALTLGIASVTGVPPAKPDLAKRQNTTDRPKGSPVMASHASEPLEFPSAWHEIPAWDEIPSAWDEGSLWDEGPAYDISR